MGLALLSLGRKLGNSARKVLLHSHKDWSVLMFFSNSIITHSLFILLCCWTTQGGGLREREGAGRKAISICFWRRQLKAGKAEWEGSSARDTKHSKTNAHYPAQCATTFLATRVTWINFLKENRLSQQQPDGLSNSLYNYSLNYLDLIIQEESHCHWKLLN